MADTTTNTTPGSPAENPSALDTLNLEANDRVSHSTEIAAIEAEMRALTGQALTPSAGRSGAVGNNNLNPRNIVGRRRLIFDRRNFLLLGLHNHGGYIEQITGHLFAATRADPAVDSINARIRSRFEQILEQRQQQAGDRVDQVSAEVIYGRALLDAVYEQIKPTDLVRIATNIASQIPDLASVPPAPALTVSALRDYYFSPATPAAPATLTTPATPATPATPNRLTPAGLELLERLRKGGASPAKVIMAFSAALDATHFNPEITVVPEASLPPVAADAPLRRGLLTEVLSAPVEGMNTSVYRNLQRIAKAVEEYEAVSEDKLEYAEPINPTPPGSGPSRDSGAQVRFMDRQEKYSRGVALLQSVQSSCQNLEIYFGTPIPPATTNPPRPDLFRNLTTTIRDLAPTGTSGNQIISRASRVRDIVSSGIGTELLKSSDYKTRAESTNIGLTGTEACDAILGEYIRRTGGVDEETAKESLASLTGRVIAAREDVRTQRNDGTEFLAVEKEKKAEKFFRKQNNDAGSRSWKNLLLTRRDSLGEYLERLNMERFFGLPAPGAPMSDRNSLTKVTERYYGLKRLSELPESDEKHLPLTSTIASELTSLRRSIIERQVRNIGREMARKGINRLQKEDVERMGLRGANIDDLPYDQIQSQLIAWLSGGAPENMSATIDAKIAGAWKPLGERKARSPWVNHPVRSLMKSAVVGGRWYNPVALPSNVVQGIWRGGKATAGAISSPFKRFGSWLNGSSKWI